MGTGKNFLPTAAFKEDTNMFSTEFREGFGFDYGYTIKLLLTNYFGPYGKIFGPQLFVRTSLRLVRTSKLWSVWTSQLVNKIYYWIAR